MSGQRTLVYRSSAVESMRADLLRARQSLHEELDTLWRGVDGELVAWSPTTISRQAEQAHRRGLEASLEATLTTVDKLEQALGKLHEAAERAETRNIALLD